MIYQITQIFPEPQNITTFIQQLAYINSLTDVGFGGILGVMILVLIFGSLFFIMKAFSYDRAFFVAIFITGFIGILFRILNLINDFVLYVCIAGIIFGLWMLIKESSQGEV